MVNPPGNRTNGSTPQFDEDPFEPLEALSWGLAVLRAEPERVGLPLVLASFSIVLSSTAVPAVLGGVARAMMATVPDSLLGTAFQAVARLVGALVGVVVTAYVSTGIYPFVLNIARGKPVEVADWFRHGDKFPRCFGLTLLMSVGVALGSAMCVLPGAVVVVFTSMAMPLLIDLDMPVIAALRGSIELVRAHFASVAVFCVLSFAAILVGTLLCFAGAVLVSIPVVLLAQAYVYLRLHGETPVDA